MSIRPLSPSLPAQTPSRHVSIFRPGFLVAAAAFAMLLWAPEMFAQQERYVQTAAELASAIASSDPGDAIVMANGIWTDTNIAFYAEGAEGDSITLRAETPGQVILNGRSSLRIWGNYLKVDGLWFDRGALSDGHVIQFRRSSSRLANHSRLTNCAITDYNPPNRLTEYKWVSVYGTNNRVDHCYFAGKTHDGATLVVWLRDPPNNAPVYHRIDNNHFGHRPNLGKNGGETIRIGTSSRSMQNAFVTVERNLFEECDGEIEIISNKSGQNTFRYNTFRRSAGTLTLRHGNDAHVYGNFFLGEGKSQTGGVRLIGERHEVYNNYFQDLTGTGYRAALAVVNGVENSPLNRYFQVKDAVVAFNTFVNTNETFVIGAGKSSEQSLPPKNLTIANNLVETTQGPIVEYEDTPVNIAYAANIMHGSALGITQPDGISTADPQLTQSGSLWRPSPSSPALNAATAFPFANADMDGQTRDATPDIGADEQAASPITNRPLTASDTGPSFFATIVSAEPLPEEVFLTDIPITNAPNPFRARTDVSFTLAESGHVRLVVYDIRGREVARLLDAPYAAGEHHVTFEASNLSTGPYVVRLIAGDRRQTHMLFRQ